MSLNKISIYIETNTKIEYRKYTIYKATLYLKTILLKNVFLKRSVWMAGIAGDLFLKLYLVILVSGKLALRGWFGILETTRERYWAISLLILRKKPTFLQCSLNFNIRKSCRDQANDSAECLENKISTSTSISTMIRTLNSGFWNKSSVNRHNISGSGSGTAKEER